MAFDLDTAVGAQLDILGEWIGRTREVPRPYLDTYFRWDDAARGWDTGVWQQPYDPTEIRVISDDPLYRRMLFAKVGINTWDGTATGTLAVLQGFFPDPATHVFVDAVSDAVQANTLFAWDTPGAGWDESVWDYPVFAFDAPNAGWDQGHWFSSLEPVGKPDTCAPVMTVGVSGKLPTLDELAILGAGLVTTKPAGVTVQHRVTSTDGAPLFGFDQDDAVIGGWDHGAWGVDPRDLVAKAA
jgi:hypothetical protein